MNNFGFGGLGFERLGCSSLGFRGSWVQPPETSMECQIAARRDREGYVSSQGALGFPVQARGSEGV